MTEQMRRSVATTRRTRGVPAGELGQGLVEYALILAVVSAVLLLALQGLGADVADMFPAAGAALNP